jgi:hypothetical protein
MTSTTALAGSPKTFEERNDWMRAVLASDLPDAAVRIAMAIALHLNPKTGQCNPAYPTLAAESHIGERSTYRLVALLEHQGWLTVQRTRGRLSNQYVLLNPAIHMAGFNPAKSRQRENSTLPNRPSNPDSAVAGESLKTKNPSRGCPSGNPLEAGRETRRASRVEESIPTPAGGPADAGPAGKVVPAATCVPHQEGEASKQASEAEFADRDRHEPHESDSRPEQDHVGDAFGELRALWRRGWAGDDTPRAVAMAYSAFGRACQEAEAGDILDAAKAWVAAADAPRFLPALPQWLAGRGWEQPPPIKRKPAPARRTAGGHRRSNGYGKPAKPDMLAVGMKLAAMYEERERETRAERGAS